MIGCWIFLKSHIYVAYIINDMVSLTYGNPNNSDLINKYIKVSTDPATSCSTNLFES